MNERFARAGKVARVDLAHEADFVLGRIEVRPSRREIVGEGMQETLEPRVMRVLVALARADGELLSRDDLIESCWDGIIVGEDAINRCVGRLRKVAEASSNAFSIETVARVGYRLRVPDIAAVEAAGVVSPELAPVASATFTTAAQSSLSTRNRWIGVFAAAIVLALAGGGFGTWWFWTGPAHAPVKAARQPAGPANSVAVLPFVNMSGDPKQEYFSDGFSQELIYDLSYDPRLRVVARTSAFAFKGKNEDVSTIARALHVRSVLEGSLREAGKRVRITAQLVNGSDGYVIWSANFDRNISDILKVQNDIARAISLSLTNRLLPATGQDHRPNSMNAEAYRDYLQGLAYYQTGTATDTAKALPLFQRAVALQQNFADAFAALASTQVFLFDFGPVYDTGLLYHAQTAANRALSLAPNNLRVLASHLYLSVHQLDWPAAILDANRMQEINPHSEIVLRNLPLYYDFLGFPDLYLKYAQKAAELDPFFVPSHENVETGLMQDGRYDEAILAINDVLVRHPGHPGALSNLCSVYARTGRLREARRITPLIADQGLKSECVIEIAIGSHDRAKAEAALDAIVPEVGKSWAYTDMGQFYAVGGFYSKAIYWLNQAYYKREPTLVLVHMNRAIAPAFFKQPGWLALMDKPRMREWKAAHDVVAGQLRE